MEKVVLANGQEFELVTNGVNSNDDSSITFTFLPGSFTVEQLVEMWTGNGKIVVKNGEVAINNYTNFIKCSSVTLNPDYLIDNVPSCPNCKKPVENPQETVCPSCHAEFAAPEMVEVRGKVCVVIVSLPDINDRMNAVEQSVDDLAITVLSLRTDGPV